MSGKYHQDYSKGPQTQNLLRVDNLDPKSANTYISIKSLERSLKT